MFMESPDISNKEAFGDDVEQEKLFEGLLTCSGMVPQPACPSFWLCTERSQLFFILRPMLVYGPGMQAQYPFCRSASPGNC